MGNDSTSIAENLCLVRQRMASACAAAGRDPQHVTLLAVSKTCPAEAVRAAQVAGQHAFGENYVQEALAKMAETADLRTRREGPLPSDATPSGGGPQQADPGAVARIEWHLIGPLQSNKTRVVAEAFDWVHTLDRLKIAERLSTQRPQNLPPLNVCLQVNVSGEASKSGVGFDELPALARAVAALPGLRLRGLMAVPEPAADLAAQRAPHRRLREAFEVLRQQGLALDTLSMGMSADLEAAVLEGATLVRVGTAIFGARA